LAMSCVVMILRFDAAASSAGGPGTAPPSTLSSIDPGRCILRSRPAHRAAHSLPTASGRHSCLPPPPHL
jgi:hypothetical protein